MNDRINLFSTEIRKDPYPTYAVLRRSDAPQQVEPGGLWAISRHDDVQFALKHPELFSSAGFEALYKPTWLPHNPLADSLITKDGDAHAKLRALVSRAFTARSIARLEPRVRAIAAESTERLKTLGEADFIAEFAALFPARVIAEILGIDPELHRDFRRWTDDIAAIAPVPPSDEFAASVRRTLAEMESYLRETVAERKRAPREDMVSDLLRAEVDGQALCDEEIIAFLFILLPAGFETTRHFFANAMFAFLDRPGDYAALRADHARIPKFVEELLRHDPPVHGVLRLLTRDVEVGGVMLPRGAMVLLLLGSANRDDARFADARRFDAERESQAGMAFGHGVHFCLGAPLARLEARIGIEALAARFRGFERLPGEITWNLVPTVRGPNELPVRFLSA